jgi:hypothetical protein
VRNATVVVNGVPVAESAHTARVVVTGLPAGRTTVMIACDGDGGEKAFTVDLPPGERVVVPLAAADTSMGKTAWQAFMAASIYAAYLALDAAL